MTFEELKQMDKEFQELQSKYVKFGASDTEPDIRRRIALYDAIMKGKKNIPQTATEWELFSCSMNCDEAAEAMTNKMTEIVEKILNAPHEKICAMKENIRNYYGWSIT